MQRNGNGGIKEICLGYRSATRLPGSKEETCARTLEKVGQIIDKSLVSRGVRIRVYVYLHPCLCLSLSLSLSLSLYVCMRVRASLTTISKTSGRVKPQDPISS